MDLHQCASVHGEFDPFVNRDIHCRRPVLLEENGQQELGIRVSKDPDGRRWTWPPFASFGQGLGRTLSLSQHTRGSRCTLEVVLSCTGLGDFGSGKENRLSHCSSASGGDLCVLGWRMGATKGTEAPRCPG